MRVTRNISVSLVRMDRHPLHPRTLSLIKHIEAGGAIPPIKVSTHPLGGYRIKDGRHRMTAYKMLGIKKIKATFSTNPQER